MIESYSYFINKVDKKTIIPQKVIIKKVTKENIEEIMNIQKEIEELDTKEYYFKIPKELLEKILDENLGYIYGYFLGDKIIASSVYQIREAEEEENLCNKIGLKGKCLEIINVSVLNDYKDNNISSNAISIANIISSKNNIKYITAFVHPENKIEVKNMLYNGLKIKKDIMFQNKYRRYIMAKEM